MTFTGCVERLRGLTPEVERWLARGPDFAVVADFTGGTKCMSAALALQARRWPCRFSFVGGTERTKDNVGVVISGKEQVLHGSNPWDALGYQAVEDALVLFDQGAAGAAGRLLEQTLRNVEGPARKRELASLKCLVEAYDAWDRFEHREALNKLNEVQKYDNDLGAVLGRQRADQLRKTLDQHRAVLAHLTAESGPTPARVQDLLANARRRGQEGRLDDAVARLYRAIEAVAQTRLREAHGIADTSKVPLGHVPEALRAQWSSRAAKGTIFLGLQDDYALLATLGDELGNKFLALGLADRDRSPLVSRNQSILAHGFDRASQKAFDQLWQSALALAGLNVADLPVFPRLGIQGFQEGSSGGPSCPPR
jgi:CRISPR-associated protein (TIGR02710 family)